MSEGRSQKTPRRLQLACDPCRTAKLKCDRNLPVCEQCFKRSRESICKYTEKGMRYNASVQTAGSMKEKINRLETLVHSLQAQQSNIKHTSPTGVNRTSDEQSIDIDGPLQMGRLKVGEGGSTHWVGPSTWESVVEDVADVRMYLEQAEHREKFEANIGSKIPVETISSTNILLPTLRGLSQAEILDAMPPRAEMDRFVAAWFNVMDPTRVIVHAPTFRTQYAHFWLDPTCVDSAWFALLLATSSLGAEISGQSLEDRVILNKADHLRTLTSQALILANPATPRPWLIECLIIYVTSLLFKQHDATSYIWQLIGLAMRLCYQAGYHRDPAGDPRFSQFDCEMRRRVWMVACELDISISNTLGMVSSVNHRLCDTQSPSNLADTDFSLEHCTPSRPHEECTLVQVEICFARFVGILGDVVVMSQAVVSASKTEIEAMSEQLHQAREQLPEKLQHKPLNQSIIDSPTEVIDRFRVEFAYQKARCVLYRRFLEGPDCQQERSWCLDAAQSIVQYSIDLLLAAQPGGQLAGLRILLMRHVHDFSLAAMLICSQLKRRHLSDTRGMMEDTMLAGDIRSKLLQACQLWDTPKLHSSKARTVLNAMFRYLHAQQTCGPTIQLPTPSEEFVSYLNSGSAPLTNVETSVGVGSYADTYPFHAEDGHSESGMVFDPMFDASCSPFENIQMGWSWPTEP